MPRKTNLKISFKDIEVSAGLVPEVPSDERAQLVCKTCSPKKTRLKEVCTLVQQGFDFDMCWTVYRCRTCKRDWAVPYRIIHALEVVQQ